MGNAIGGGLFADVHGQHAGEKIWPCGEGADGARAQASAAVEQQHQVGHPFGAATDAPVFGMVVREIAGFERRGQRHGLLEKQAEAFAGDGIDRAGSIAYQRYIAAAHGLEAPRRRNATALEVGRTGG